MFINNLIPELNDISYFEKDGTEKALDYAKTFSEKYEEPVNFYLYWIGENLNYKHNVVVKSFLATQNLKFCKLVIYSDISLEENIIFKEFDTFKDNIEFRIFDVYEESKNTILENSSYLEFIKNHTLNAALESDFFRLLILYKYGGVYCDFDILFLRDLSPLLKYEFVYKWQNYSIGDLLNGAVMRLFKNSEISTQMLEKMSKATPYIRSLCWASDIYTSVAYVNKNLVIFPASFFNTEWQLNIPIEGFDLYQWSNELFDGSFTWHWHNRWDYEIKPNSKFDILDKIISEKLKKIK
jgi:hypothetical protein